MVQHRNVVGCFLVAVAAGTIIQSDAFSVTTEEINKSNCLQRLLESDEDGSGFLELAELQRFVNTTASLLPCKILAGASLEDADEFCMQLWTRCPVDEGTFEPPDGRLETVPPQTNAPASNPTEQNSTTTILMSETNEAEQEPVYTSTLPPIGEDDVDVALPPPEEECSFVQCHQWFLIGAPVLLGLIVGLCLGLIYVESRGGWQQKPELAEDIAEDPASTAAVVVPMYSSKHQDIEAGNFEHSQAVAIIRTHSLNSRSEILDTLPEAANESDSEFMSDMVSHSTMGDSETAAFSHMSDTTPLHHNKRPVPPLDLDDVDSTTTSSSISLSENLDFEHDAAQKLTKDKTYKPTKFTTTQRVIATFAQKKQHGTSNTQTKQTYTQPVVVSNSTSLAASAPRRMNVSPSRQPPKNTSTLDPAAPKQRRSYLSKSKSWHADKDDAAFPVKEVSTRRNSKPEDDELNQRRARSLVSVRSSSVGRVRAVSQTSTRRARSSIHLATTQLNPVVHVSEDLEIAVRQLPTKQKSWRTFRSEELSL